MLIRSNFFRSLVLFCLIFISAVKCEDPLTEEDLQACCEDGEYWLYSGGCNETPDPDKSQQCVDKAKSCCETLKSTNEQHCNAGIEVAKNNGDCNVQTQEQTQSCCETCKFALSLGSAGGCLDKSEPYHTCCLLAQNKKAEEPEEKPTSASQPTPASNVSEQDPCEQYGNEMCAHKCVPNGASYLCTCRPGFKLRPDNHSCQKIDQDRCLKNNPCEQKCLDTGEALVCSCNRGYELLEDNISCIDVDECTLETHKCPANKICVNTIGSYRCVDDPSKPKNDTEEKHTKLTCPVGYKPNKKNLVCDDIDECEENPCPSGRHCVNTVGSYTCSHRGVAVFSNNEPSHGMVSIEESCPPGFKLHPNKQDCVDIDECSEGLDDCNRLSQNCINYQGSFYCQNKASKTNCPPGYKYDGQGCVDIDECAENGDLCTPDSYCVNDLGSYDCKLLPAGAVSPPVRPPVPNPVVPGRTIRPNKPITPNNSRVSVCPSGYRRTYNGGCADINECLEGTHFCDEHQECRNILGGHRCICRRGFTKDPITSACVDINECQRGDLNDCIDGQRCDNTIGSYQCIRYTSCGTGYTLNAATGICEDNDECALGTHNCNVLGPQYECVNTRGTFRCVRKKPPTTTPVTTTTDSEYYYYEEEVEETSTETSIPLSPPIHPIYVPLASTTTETPHSRTTPPSQHVYQDPRRYPSSPPRVLPPQQYPPPTDRTPPSRATNKYPEILDLPRVDISANPNTAKKTYIIPINTAIDTNKLPENTIATLVPREKHCLPGYAMNHQGECDDIDECAQKMYSCNTDTEICENTPGAYKCVCADGHIKDPTTGYCKKIAIVHPPAVVIPQWRQRPMRTCDIGFHVDPKTNECIDIDECIDGSARCAQDEVCVNSQGGYTCQCREGFRLVRGRCESIEPPRFTPPPARPLPPPTRVVTVTKPPPPQAYCPRGYRLGDDGKCIDIDECTYGVHTCTVDQLCVNVPGGYLCRCDHGHKVVNGVCVDIDECEETGGRICPPYSKCLNTVGSYVCECKPGFTQSPRSNQTCTDVNECEANNGKGPCHQKCVNTWGAFRCACNKGFRLQYDNRTCVDFDECADTTRRLCVGSCINTPGSYECGCPKGYKLGRDHRMCLDIDECETGEVRCGPNESCQNIRGGARCNSMACPPGYTRDPGSKQRCRKIYMTCNRDDIACQRQPMTYSYNFITFVSNLYIPQGPKPQIDLFTMKGPTWPGAQLNFQLKLVDVKTPPGIERATVDCFRLSQSTQQALVSLVKPLIGPQDIHLELAMELYSDRTFEGTAVAKIFIYVSEYEF